MNLKMFVKIIARNFPTVSLTIGGVGWMIGISGYGWFLAIAALSQGAYLVTRQQ